MSVAPKSPSSLTYGEIAGNQAYQRFLKRLERIDGFHLLPNGKIRLLQGAIEACPLTAPFSDQVWNDEKCRRNLRLSSGIAGNIIAAADNRIARSKEKAVRRDLLRACRIKTPSEAAAGEQSAC